MNILVKFFIVILIRLIMGLNYFMCGLKIVKSTTKFL